MDPRMALAKPRQLFFAPLLAVAMLLLLTDSAAADGLPVKVQPPKPPAPKVEAPKPPPVKVEAPKPPPVKVEAPKPPEVKVEAAKPQTVKVEAPKPPAPKVETKPATVKVESKSPEVKAEVKAPAVKVEAKSEQNGPAVKVEASIPAPATSQKDDVVDALQASGAGIEIDLPGPVQEFTQASTAAEPRTESQEAPGGVLTGRVDSAVERPVEVVEQTISTAASVVEPVISQVADELETVVAPAEEVLEPVVAPSVSVLAPVIQAVTRQVRPAAELLLPSAAPVLELVSELTESELAPLTDNVTPLIDPLLETVEPVIEPVSALVSTLDQAADGVLTPLLPSAFDTPFSVDEATFDPTQVTPEPPSLPISSMIDQTQIAPSPLQEVIAGLASIENGQAVEITGTSDDLTEGLDRVGESVGHDGAAVVSSSASDVQVRSVLPRDANVYGTPDAPQSESSDEPISQPGALGSRAAGDGGSNRRPESVPPTSFWPKSVALGLLSKRVTSGAEDLRGHQPIGPPVGPLAPPIPIAAAAGAVFGASGESTTASAFILLAAALLLVFWRTLQRVTLIVPAGISFNIPSPPG